MGFKGSKDENWFAGNCAVNVTSWFACRLYFCAWANTYFHVGHIHGEKMGEMGRLEVCVSVKCPEGIGWYTFIHLPFQVATILVQFAKGTFWPTICHMVFAHQFSFFICKLSGRYENRITILHLIVNVFVHSLAIKAASNSVRWFWQSNAFPINCPFQPLRDSNQKAA